MPAPRPTGSAGFPAGLAYWRLDVPIPYDQRHPQHAAAPDVRSSAAGRQAGGSSAAQPKLRRRPAKVLTSKPTTMRRSRLFSESGIE
ncbi:MAG: hypothetical protein N838_20530 [Thiohalocapsa sp. PB-PSB1]|nr:MAG: hypothetical protein N838_18445 [Thiohalocapsa sp. PB-PSB1]QQO55376.1 MAG: hypothetical protein N838_20530 [Thiohalocapsa sp. PB-PSB1]HCS92797.1 hypothetical protein [Chromatiaceae bacterium]